MSIRVPVFCGVLMALTLQNAFSKEDAYVEGEVLVTFKPALEEEGAKAALTRHSMRWTDHYDAISKQRRQHSGLVRDKSRTTASLIAELKADTDVEVAEPNYIRHVSATTAPSDLNFVKLWALNNSGQTVNAVAGTSGVDSKFLEAWKLAKPNPNQVVIGVVDTGVDITHPDLAGNIWINPGEIPGNGIDDDGDGYVDDVNGYDFAGSTATITDSGYHGTHVAGTIAAIGNNSLGVIGVDYLAKILPMKVSTDGESINTSAALAAFNYAVKLKQAGVNIVALNASFGGSSSSTSEKTAIQALSNAGIILCAAAGNETANNDTTPSYPANYAIPNIISVAAIDQNGNLADFSNYGATTVDIAAPGVNIYSTQPVSQAVAVPTVTIGSTTYSGAQIEYAGTTSAAGLNKKIYNCGLGNTVDFPSGVKGNIALMQRGTLNFSDKVTNAKNAGAVGAIISDNIVEAVDANGWTLGAAGSWIPAIRVTQDQGKAIAALVTTSGTLGTLISYPDPSQAYQFLDGTSMATPHVTGAVGFAAMNFPADTMAQRITRILSHVTPEAALSGKVSSGGRLNLLGIVDTDNDGLPDWWETDHFGNLTATGTDDTDGDGDSNLDEFLDGTDPVDAGSHLAFSGFLATSDTTGDQFVLSFPTVVDRTYDVEYSDTLTEGSWTMLGSPVAGTGSVLQVTDTASRATAPHRFYRLHVE
jgi:subtilisin family serine protease